MAQGFIIGGCWYRLQCRDRVAASIAHLAYFAGQMNAPFLGLRVMHTSNLWTGRCEWLHGAIKNEDLRFAVSVDADTAFDATGLIASLPKMADRDAAIGCAPVRVGGTDGVCNLNIAISDETNPRRDGVGKGREARATAQDLERVLSGNGEIASGGFGLAVFHLDWFRKHWPKPKPEIPGPNNWVGEDIAFCQSVRMRGGKIFALPIETEHHEFKP